ncbi:MAG: hypothetical protein GY822_03910 [Deltaproteobacteria bacterium]|nr:hypothetical protein [Deltaproteobacteria bacterium]
MKIAPSLHRARIYQAIELFRKNDKALPNNLSEAVDELRSMDTVLSAQLGAALGGKDEFVCRVSFQRALAGVQNEVTSESEQARHQFSGTAFGAAAFIFRQICTPGLWARKRRSPKSRLGWSFRTKRRST